MVLVKWPQSPILIFKAPMVGLSGVLNMRPKAQFTNIRPRTAKPPALNHNLRHTFQLGYWAQTRLSEFCVGFRLGPEDSM